MIPIHLNLLSPKWPWDELYISYFSHLKSFPILKMTMRDILSLHLHWHTRTSSKGYERDFITYFPLKYLYISQRLWEGFHHFLSIETIVFLRNDLEELTMLSSFPPTPQKGRGGGGRKPNNFHVAMKRGKKGTQSHVGKWY